MTITTVALFPAFIASAACVTPPRQATRLDPITALRAE
jgi:ABC-type lipoprotein release transport system permease subunit